MFAGHSRLIAAALLPVAAVAIAAETGPAARMADYNQAILAILKQRLPLKARADRFDKLISGYYDMPGIAALVIGPSWAVGTPADRTAVTAALARHSAVSLASNFVKFGGERSTVDPMVLERGDSRIVKVTIASPGSSDVLYFRLHQVAGGSWRIVDVIADGVSQLAVQRADLATTARAGLAAVARRLGQIDDRTLAGH